MWVLAGPKVDAALGLRSTFFTVRTETGAIADPSTAPTDDAAAADTGAIDPAAQSGLLAAADPTLGADESTSADQTFGATDPATDTAVGELTDSTAIASTTTAATSIEAPATASEAGLSTSAEFTPGETHRDSSFDLALGTGVAAVVLAAIAIVRRKRRA